MPKIDVTDEAVINAPPMDVYKAVLDMYAGVTNWWMPDCESKLRENAPTCQEGATVDLTVHTSPTKTKFSCKMTKIVEGKSIEEEFGGDYVGTGKWTFEPTNGKTKVQFRWVANPKRLLFVCVSPFVNIGKRHSEVMQKGFKALNSYLSKK